MVNRKTAPEIHEVRHLTMPRPELVHLDNGIPVYVLDFPGQEIVKLEAVFRAGRPEEAKRLAARATARLIREGTVRQTAAEIAEHLDYFGASINVPTNLDTSSFVLFSVKKYAHEVIPTFAEMLLQPAFPQEELENFRRTSIQELTVELEKGETVAYRKVTELIFGEQHPYGYNSMPEDYQSIERADILEYYRKWYIPANCLLFASGSIDAGVLSMINREFGQHSGPAMPGRNPLPGAAEHPNGRKIKIPLPGSLQTAIKIGRRLFDRNHPDFNGMVVLNTLLGGYFGSRLMTNIREKKGYTYNIYATVDAYLNDGCHYIATEVSPEKSGAAIRAIFSELRKLREKPVPEEELSMVRNYILGMLLNGLDGPINSSDMVRNMIVEHQSPEKFEALVHTVRTISVEQIQALAQRYLQDKDFWVVTVG
ncbi:MAG: insulinase family protein [Chitinophagales bacterium]|nr:insulinase family protein [Chitinophagales bacterium]